MKLYSPKTLILPVIAVVSLGAAITTVLASPPDQSSLPPPQKPLSSPDTDNNNMSIVAGTGLIESASEDIEIGSHLSGVVHSVMVHEGDKVQKGEALFTLDTRNAKAQLSVSKARLQTAQAQMQNARSQLHFYESVQDKAAISKEELSRRRYSYNIAKAQFEEAKANLEDSEAHLALHTVTAPIDGEILQVDIRPGEYAKAGKSDGKPLIRLGDTSYLHARVDVDEFDIGKLHQGLNAELSPKGNASITLKGSLVQIEPFVRPKRTLSGAAQELVDTRVLQLVFRINDANAPVYPGQQIDAYIKSNTNQPLLSISKKADKDK